MGRKERTRGTDPAAPMFFPTFPSFLCPIRSGPYRGYSRVGQASDGRYTRHLVEE